jgi:septation ring formation regulator EzrA
MTVKKLSNEELSSANKIVNEYRTIESEFTEIQSQLEKIDAEKVNLLSRLDAIRSEELEFYENLEDKYGKGKIDLLTFEYISEK